MFNFPTRLRSAGPSLARVRSYAMAGLVALSGLAAASVARAQDVFRPPPPVTYTQKYEIYGNINFANGQAGQNIPKRYNMAGGGVMATWWVTPKWGAAADVHWEGGTTPVFPLAQSVTPRIQTLPFVSQMTYMGGAQYHWLGNQHVGVNLHGLAGASSGNFDHSNPGVSPETFFYSTGLYTNRTSFNAMAGASIDFNRSARWAIRVQPDLVFEHFGTELREFVSVSAGVVYRFGER